jgi:hypothetical protein
VAVAVAVAVAVVAASRSLCWTSLLKPAGFFI